MTINLQTINYQINNMRKKRNRERDPETMFMLRQIAPASHSRHIANDYVLNVNVKFDGCTCCSVLPSISVPLTIIPLTHMDSYGFLEPEGYQPYELGYFKFNVNAY
jgi:hypothetical protein